MSTLMPDTEIPNLNHPDLLRHLHDASPQALDRLPFGVIGFDASGTVVRYNAYEAEAAQFSADAVIGQHVFIELAPCLNNYLVAGRFDETLGAGSVLDESLPYVLTFRMRPTRVQMRLLADPAQPLRFLCIQRTAGAKA